MGGKNPVAVEKVVTTTSTVCIGCDFGREPVEVTVANLGVDKHWAGARLFSNRRRWGQVLMLPQAACRR